MKGAVAGLAVAIVLLTIGHGGIVSGTALSKPFDYLTSIPPFLLPAVRYFSDFGVTVLYLVWWPAVGGTLGWCLGRGHSGRIMGAVAIVALVAGHILARDAIVREFSSLDGHMKRLVHAEGRERGSAG